MEQGVFKPMGGQVASRLLIGMVFYFILLREVYHDPGIQNVDLDDLAGKVVDLFYTGMRTDLAE